MEALGRLQDDDRKWLVEASCVPEEVKRIVVNELRLCSRWRDLHRGKLVHALAIQNGIDSNIYVANTLLDMYAKCTSMLEARGVFEGMRQRSIVSWNVLIAGYADNGDGMASLRLFAQLEGGGCPLTYVSAIKACAALAAREEAKGGKLVKLGSLAKGLAVHRRAGAMGCDADIRVTNTLISMYAKCGSLVDAKRTFDASVQVKDVVSWNALILGYIDNGEGFVALELFGQLLAVGAHTNCLTLVAALKACGLVAAKDAQLALQKGLAIHLQAVLAGCLWDMYVANALVDMFAKCRALRCAHRIFNTMPDRDVVSWNTLISGSAESGEVRPALELFCVMELDLVPPNSLSVVGALKSCASLSGSEEEKIFVTAGVHRRAVDCGCNSDLRVACSLVAAYARCSRMTQAQKVFDAMSQHDVVSWTALIAGYADNGEADLALKLYNRMKDCGCQPNAFTLAAVVKACGALDAIQTGEELHRETCQLGLQGDTGVATSLIYLYAKCCSSMKEARKVFDSLDPKSKNLLTWTALLDGYSRHGDAEQAFQVFQAMQEHLVEPNEVTFLCLLTACNHAGLVDRGCHYFHDMAVKYGISPKAEHYACVVDMLGRANRLRDALQLLDSMPFAPDAVTWTALLAAARKWKNVELAGLAFQSLLRLGDVATAASYELMANTL